MRKFLRFILRFIPRRCAVCGCEMGARQEHICFECRMNIPLTDFIRQRDNVMLTHLRNNVPQLRGAMALIYFAHESGWRWMLHKMKFQQREWYHALLMGRWFGYELEREGYGGEFDCVVAVPLHSMRLLHRGYNQSDYLAQGICQVLGSRHIVGAISRSRNNNSQLNFETLDRWGNVEALFTVEKPDMLAGRRILLIDDIMTTGATMSSCARTIIERLPSVELWIATLAVSWWQFGMPRNEKS